MHDWIGETSKWYLVCTPTIGRCQKPDVLDYLLYPEGQKIWKKTKLMKEKSHY